MALDLRPVIEKWGPSYGYLLSHEGMVDLLGEIADRAGIEHKAVDYADLERVWIADGRKFLNFLAGGQQAIFQAKADGHDLADQEIQVVEDLAGMVEQWRAWVDPDDGALRIYVD